MKLLPSELDLFLLQKPEPLGIISTEQGVQEWDWRGNGIIQKLEDSAPRWEDLASKPPAICQGGRVNFYPRS